MPPLTLVANQIYSLKVVEITKTQKLVKKKDGHSYRRYDILLQDKDGATTFAEYLSFDEEQKVFYKGLFQFIRCGFVAERGTIKSYEIEPAEDPALVYAPAPKEEQRTGDISSIPSQIMTPAPLYNVGSNVSGKLLIFAYSEAKDLLAAEIGCWPPDRQVTKEDISRMIEMGDQIADAMIYKLNNAK